MGSFSILRRISQDRAAGNVALRLIFRSPNCCGGRMISTVDSAYNESPPPPSPPPPPPWLMLPPAFGGGDMIYRFYSLAEKKVLYYHNTRGAKSEESPDDDAKFVGSSHGWLALFNQRNGDLFLSHPISGQHIKLPPIHTLPFPEANLKPDFVGCVSKVIISCSPEEAECVAMMTFGQGERLAFCSPGRSTEWKPIGDPFLDDEEPSILYARVYEDFVYCSKQKLFTCVTQFRIELTDDPDLNLPGELEDWDIQDPRSPRIEGTWLLKYEGEKSSWWKENIEVLINCRQIQHLVYAEQSNQLFLVMRFVTPRMGTVGFSVFKVDREKDEEEGALTVMEGSLNGLAMFIGINHSFVMSASEFPELKPNSIYFTDAKPGSNGKKIYIGYGLGIFDYESKTTSPCYYSSCDVQTIERIVPPAMWFTPSQSPSCCGSRGGRMTSTVDSAYESSPSAKRIESSPSSRISSPPPWLMLPPAFGGGDMIYRFYSLAEKKVLCYHKKRSLAKSEESPSPDDDAKFMGSSHGWLALFNQRNCDLFLSHPISGRHIKLPPIHNLPIPEVNLKGGSGCVSKVIISCSPDDEEEECRAMMTFGTTDRLAFCSPGRSMEWTPIGTTHESDDFTESATPRPYEDFVYSSRHKLFFCITGFPADDLEAWDLRDPLSPRIDWMVEDYEFDYDEEDRYNLLWPARSRQQAELRDVCSQQKYIVFAEQSNQLFLVVQHILPRMRSDGSYAKSIFYGPFRGWDNSYPDKTIDFDVYKIDREGERRQVMRYMDGHLDGLSMFIGRNHSFAMSSAEFSELKPNAIYFTDSNLTSLGCFTGTYGGHDNGIFDYENRTFSSCYYPCDYQSIRMILPPPMWFTPSPDKY